MPRRKRPEADDDDIVQGALAKAKRSMAKPNAKAQRKTASKTASKAAAKPKRTRFTKASPTTEVTASERKPPRKKPKAKTRTKRGPGLFSRLWTGFRAAGPTRKGGKSAGSTWRRWLVFEVLTVVGGVMVGLAIASSAAWVRATRDVEAYLANPPRPVSSVVWSAPMSVRVGGRISMGSLASDLLAAGYERVDAIVEPRAEAAGVFTVSEDALALWSNPWTSRGKHHDGGKATIKVKNSVVSSLSGVGVTRDLLTLRPTVLGTLGDPEGRRDRLSLEAFSPLVEPVLLAMEDSRFRAHHGIDPVGVIRALVVNAFSEETQGASTLTQQLAKNLFLTKDRTLRRKVREVFFAAALENLLDKDSLLELYLSEVYLGQMGGLPLYGVDAAARGWFGVSASRLELDQVATIVGAIPAPNAWSPVRHPEASLERRNVVLQRLVDVGIIDAAAHTSAQNRPLALQGLEPSRVRRAPYAVDAAIDRAEEILGEGALAAGGYRIHTGIQPVLQHAAEEAIALGMAELDKEYPKAAGAQVALVAVRIDDGAVVAMVGGRSYAGSAFNRASHAYRQAGSTVKPFTMLAAFDLEIANPATVLEDAPITRTADGVSWTPQNYDNQFMGTVTVRQAIEGSRNIPAIHLAEGVGAGRLQRFVRDAGISRATHLPSAALGAYDASPLEMASAYTAFHHGVAYRPRVALAIETVAGEPVIDLPPEGRRIASDQAAALAINVLQGVLVRGTATRAGHYGVGAPAAGKTGTTDAYRDAWFVGVTPELAVAVWVGRDEGLVGLSGSRAALPTWARFVAASGTNVGSAPRPSGLSMASVCPESGLLARDACPDPYEEWFISDAMPEDKCDVHGSPLRGRLFGRWFGRKDRSEEGEGEGDADPDAVGPPPTEPRGRKKKR